MARVGSGLVGAWHYVPDGGQFPESIKNHAAFIWPVADLLRGDHEQSEYGKVILPLTVLRRFDCVLAPVKQEMLATYDGLQGKVDNFGPILDALTAVDGLWNTSRFDLPKLLDDPDHIRTTSSTTSPGSRPRPVRSRLLHPDGAHRLVAKGTGGRLGPGKDDVVWQGPVWIPAAIVQLTLRKYGLLQRKPATSQAWAVYDLIGGTFVTRLDEEPERTSVELDGPRLDQILKLADPAKNVERAIGKWHQVTSDEATAKYRKQMDRLGAPEMHTADVGTSTSFLYPLHIAIAARNGSERVVDVDAFRRPLDDDLSLELSKQITSVRASIA